MGAVPTSRLKLDLSTQRSSIQSFGELSQFLRSAMADDESLQLARGMGALVTGIETVLQRLQVRCTLEEAAAPLMDLMTTLREHRLLVIGLSPVWRGLYEYAAYLAALNNFRVLIGVWLLPPGQSGQASPAGQTLGHQPVPLEDFELVAWRTLGEGVLLVDMYEQMCEQAPVDSGVGALEASRLARARSWWTRLRK